MKFDILTLFPEILKGFLNESLIKKALERGLLFINLIDLRDFTIDKHKTADDKPFGGGPGMVMMIDPILKAVEKLKTTSTKIIFFTPSGQKLTQDKVKSFSKEKHFILICGRYEGIDERITKIVDEQISIGDYVLFGGELPAAVFIEAVSRYIPFVVKESLSVEQESFENNLLDYPNFTKPAKSILGDVPEMLLKGNHFEISKWRRKQQLKKTLFLRPDLFAKAQISSKTDIELIDEIISEI